MTVSFLFYFSICSLKCEFDTTFARDIYLVYEINDYYYNIATSRLEVIKPRYQLDIIKFSIAHITVDIRNNLEL